MSAFEARHVNRTTMPDKHVIVCEDDLNQQARIAAHLAKLFGGQGRVEVNFMCGSIFAAVALPYRPCELIILDHDMPHGNGSDLLAALDNREWTPYSPRPAVITFSGIEQNNDLMATHPGVHKFGKEQVLAGEADGLIKQILGLA